MEMARHFPHMIPKQCEICKTKDNLLRCGACGVYWYCSREHQAADRSTHKSTCNTIKNGKKNADDLEVRLRADGFFDYTKAAHWTLPPAAVYLRARFMYGEFLIRSWRQQGVAEALKVFMDLIRYNRSDLRGCKQVIPELFLRLGRDQESYDFLSWWSKAIGAYDFDNPSLPFLDTKDANAIEEPLGPWVAKDVHVVDQPSLCELASLMLLKIRLLLGLRLALEARTRAPDRTGAEVLAKIRPYYSGDILERRPDLIADIEALKNAVKQVHISVVEIFHTMLARNQEFFNILTSPTERDFAGQLTDCLTGTPEEARLAFTYTWNAWVESPGALEFVEKELVGFDWEAATPTEQ